MIFIFGGGLFGVFCIYMMWAILQASSMQARRRHLAALERQSKQRQVEIARLVKQVQHQPNSGVSALEVAIADQIIEKQNKEWDRINRLVVVMVALIIIWAIAYRLVQAMQ